MLKSAVIGLGQIGLTYDFDDHREHPSGHTLAYEMSPEFELVAAVDVRPQQEGLLRLLARNAIFYTSINDMLDALPQLDVISVCTPPLDRVELVSKIINCTTAKVIFCEKPVARNSIEALRLLSLMDNHPEKILVPNLSRRWNVGIINVRESIQNNRFGSLEKIHIRYTRGIYNTGSHIFDLIKLFSGPIDQVKVLHKVYTSSEKEGESTFTFIFTIGETISGFAEAYNDENYYMFEIDLYFQCGKIEIVHSGDEIRYYDTDSHPLFQGFKSLHLSKTESALLQHSNMAQAIQHLSDVASGCQMPVCTLIDGVYPLFVAEALERSYSKHGTYEKVSVVK